MYPIPGTPFKISAQGGGISYSIPDETLDKLSDYEAVEVALVLDDESKKLDIDSFGDSLKLGLSRESDAENMIIYPHLDIEDVETLVNAVKKQWPIYLKENPNSLQDKPGYTKKVEKENKPKSINDQLLEAALQGNIKLMEQLLQKGADIHYKNGLFIIYLGMSGKTTPEAIKMLLRYGVSPMDMLDAIGSHMESFN